MLAVLSVRDVITVGGRTWAFGCSLLACFYDCGRPPQSGDVWPGLSAFQNWCVNFLKLSNIDVGSISDCASMLLIRNNFTQLITILSMMWRVDCVLIGLWTCTGDI